MRDTRASETMPTPHTQACTCTCPGGHDLPRHALPRPPLHSIVVTERLQSSLDAQPARHRRRLACLHRARRPKRAAHHPASTWHKPRPSYSAGTPCCVRREQRGAYTLRAYTRSKCTPAHPPPRACARKRAYSGHDKSGDGGVIYRQCLVGAPSSTATSSGCGRCSISSARAVRCASPLTSSCALPPRIHWKRAL